MFINYLDQFPIPSTALPPRLKALLEPVGESPALKVEVTTRWEKDKHGPNREYVHMIMAVVPDAALPTLKAVNEARHGLVSYSVPDIEVHGGLKTFTPSVSGYDYIVASWEDNSFYSYALAEKFWMALGLSSRTLGGKEQRIVYDDLSIPEFGVAEGEVSTNYYFSSERDVRWVVSNEYLRKYLWMRGSHGVRVFFYEALLPDNEDIRSIMARESHVCLSPEGGWYQLDIREFKGGLLIQVWASVAAVAPELCTKQTAEDLTWPGMKEPMTHAKADALRTSALIYLDDRFLERYEQSSFFDATPVNAHGRWHCGPSYLGQWSFNDCVRVGRNLIATSIRDLYEAKPDREIIHAHAFALDPLQVSAFSQDEEHIVAKTERFVTQLLDFDDLTSRLCVVTAIDLPPQDITGISRVEILRNGWMQYPQISRLAQVAPLCMTEQAFLARCKSIHELWQKIPNSSFVPFFKRLVIPARTSRT
jgi:hypothetical protein